MKLNKDDDRFKGLVVKLLLDGKFRAAIVRIVDTLDRTRQKFATLRARLTGRPAATTSSDAKSAPLSEGIAEAALDALFKSDPSPAKREKQPDALPKQAATVGWLMVKSGQTKGKWFDLTPGEIKIGAAESCGIRIADDETVSQEHAAVHVTANECKIADLRSQSGTFVNDERVRSQRVLQEGDVVRVGNTTMDFIKA